MTLIVVSYSVDLRGRDGQDLVAGHVEVLDGNPQ